MPQVPDRAVEGLTVYILGCQPGIRDQYLRPSGKPYDRTLMLDPQEPDNVGFYGWPMAIAAIDGQSGHQDLQRQLFRAAVKAAGTTRHIALLEGLAVPLQPPKRFASFSSLQWTDLSVYFQPRT